jgi:membrane associated rhomboid family serine protease
MFLLPIGLGNSLHRFPWTSLAIVILCSFITVDNLATQNPELQEIQSQSHKREVELWPDYIFLVKQQSAKIENLRELGSHIDLDLEVLNKYRPYTSFHDSSMDLLKNIASENEIEMTFQLQLSISKMLQSLDIQSPEKFPEELKKTEEYKRIKAVRAHNMAAQKNLYNKLNYLSFHNFHLKSIFTSVFSHLSWVHLFFNCIIILFIGSLLEQKIGHLRLMGLFLFGGSIPLIVQILVDREIAVLGASGGVYAILGYFYISFYHFRMNYFLFYVCIYTVINLPIKWSIPLFFFTIDITSVLLNINSGVSHIAHVTGLILGLIIGHYDKKRQKLLTDQIYPIEQELLNNIRKSDDEMQICEDFCRIMKLNSQNKTALMTYFVKSQSLNVLPEKQAKLDWISKKIGRVLFNETNQISNIDALTWIFMIPKGINLALCFSPFSIQQVIGVADAHATAGNYQQALDLYKYAKKRKPKAKTVFQINHSINRIETILLGDSHVNTQPT